jgi:uncharacterized delta-60 repeat protein
MATFHERLEPRTLMSAGDLDTNFGDLGRKALANLNGWTLYAAQKQSDGKILVAGSRPSSAGGNIVIARLLANGDGLDTTFDGDGVKVLDYSGNTSAPAGGIFTNSNRILVSGGLINSGGGFVGTLAVLNISNGALDTSFDGDGLKNFDLGGNGGFATDVVAANNRYYVTGSSSDGYMVALAFNGSGTEVGRMKVLPGAGLSIAADAAGRILVGGLRSTADGEDVSIARLNSNLTYDSSFGDGAEARFNFRNDPYQRVLDLSVDASGSILFAGTTGSGNDRYAYAGRLLSDGTPDSDFGNLGVSIFDFRPADSRETATRITVDDSGRIVVGGSTFASGATRPLVFRLGSDGVLDSSFGPNGDGVVDSGVFAGAVSSSADAFAVAQGNDVIVAASLGSSRTPTLARLIGDEPLPQFGSIEGLAFDDTNRDGLYQPGEPTLSGVTVYLDLDEDNVKDSGEPTTVTGTGGGYVFDGLDASVYRVVAQAKSGYTTPAAQFADVFADEVTTTNLPFRKNPTTFSAAGIVYNDVNANGVKDSNEGAIGGGKAFIDANNNGRLDTGEKNVTVAANGTYTITGLTAGTYRLATVPPTGYRTSAPSSGFFTITVGPNATGRNFLVTQRVRISGNVFNDANGDRTRQSSEGYLANWRVFIDANKDGIWQSSERSVLTDSGGKWSFANLTAGTYRIRVVQQSGWTRTTPTSGSFDVTLSNGTVRDGLLFGQKR